MSISINGNLCYGVLFDSSFHFPWKSPGELEDWWQKVQGFKPRFYPFDNKGDYLEGLNRYSSDVSIYFDEVCEWERKNPVPIEMVNYYSGDCPMYIITTPVAAFSSSGGNPISIDPQALLFLEQKTRLVLLQFFNRFEIECESEPSWYLSCSFYQ